MRKKCSYCLTNLGRWDIKTQDYTADCFECIEARKNPKKVVVDETPIDDDPCEICLSRPKRWLNSTKKALLCLACDKQIKQEKKMMKVKQPKFIDDYKECKTCKKRFQFKYKSEQECHFCKETKSIRKSNENWLNRKPKKKPKMDSNAVAYAFFRKKYTVPNNVFRG